jgi:hypothetical protein
MTAEWPDVSCLCCVYHQTCVVEQMVLAAVDHLIIVRRCNRPREWCAIFSALARACTMFTMFKFRGTD